MRRQTYTDLNIPSVMTNRILCEAGRYRLGHPSGSALICRACEELSDVTPQPRGEECWCVGARGVGLRWRALWA